MDATEALLEHRQVPGQFAAGAGAGRTLEVKPDPARVRRFCPPPR
jgi:hypothetical protein